MSKLVPGQVSKLMVAYRLKANLSQSELVARLGYKNVGAQVRISNWERGATSISLTPAARKTLAKLLEVNVPDLTKMLTEDMAARKDSLSKDKAAKKSAAPAPKAAAAPKAKPAAKKAAKAPAKKAAKPAKKAAKKAAFDAVVKREVAVQSASGSTRVIPKTFETPAKAAPGSDDKYLSSWRKTIDPASEMQGVAQALGPPASRLSMHEHLAAALMAGEPTMTGVSPAAFVRLVAQYLSLTAAFVSASAR